MKILLFILFVILSIQAYSQSNLQFNKVKLVTSPYTVPTGKVWKIESIMTPENCENIFYSRIMINNQQFVVSHTIFGTNYVGNTNGVVVNEMMKLPT